MSEREPEAARPGETTEAIGPPPFITRRVRRAKDGSQTVWSSRHHRKGLIPPEVLPAIALRETLRRGLYSPQELNWWIGVIFAIGASLFAVGSIFSLWPTFTGEILLSATANNAIYFAGSIPFTTAAYLQLFQAANTVDVDADATARQQRLRMIGWRPHDIGWLSCIMQFVGTVLFNFNTFDAMLPQLTWFERDLAIWVPDFVGSVLFLASGYLAFIETCHAYWGWRPKTFSWWVVFMNLLGCVGFMTSAVFAVYLPGPPHEIMATLAVALTLLGALGFLFGSLLMLPEQSVVAKG